MAYPFYGPSYHGTGLTLDGYALSSSNQHSESGAYQLVSPVMPPLAYHPPYAHAHPPHHPPVYTPHLSSPQLVPSGAVAPMSKASSYESLYSAAAAASSSTAYVVAPSLPPPPPPTTTLGKRDRIVSNEEDEDEDQEDEDGPPKSKAPHVDFPFPLIQSTERAPGEGRMTTVLCMHASGSSLPSLAVPLWSS